MQSWNLTKNWRIKRIDELKKIFIMPNFLTWLEFDYTLDLLFSDLLFVLFKKLKQMLWFNESSIVWKVLE